MKLKKLLSVILAMTVTAISCIPVLATTIDTGFTDVAAEVWYAEAVKYCVNNKLMGGTSETEFSPEGDLSRAMLASVLYRAKGSPAVTNIANFSDVLSDQWYSNSIAWAVENNILSGYGNHVFEPNDAVTREQVAAILWRYKESPATKGTTPFTDAQLVSDWAANAVTWVSENNIMNTRDTNIFAPKLNATRAELAFALMNCFNTVPQKETTVEIKETVPSAPTDNAEEQKNSNTLIAYFSKTGNTKQIATFISEYTDGDMIEITAKTPYPNSYEDVLKVAEKEQDEDFRPELSMIVDNIDNYDVIFIGYPIWYGESPMAVYSFLETYDLSNKTVIPFSTSGGSGISTSIEKIREICKNSTVLDGLLVSGSSASNAQSIVESWIEGLNILPTAIANDAA